MIKRPLPEAFYRAHANAEGPLDPSSATGGGAVISVPTVRICGYPVPFPTRSHRLAGRTSSAEDQRARHTPLREPDVCTAAGVD